MALDLLPDNHPEVDPASLYVQITDLPHDGGGKERSAPILSSPIVGEVPSVARRRGKSCINMNGIRCEGRVDGSA
ncbi:MAG TPA: hypothetical protein VHX61_00745 [Rhizomicrobium sp.]|jgi:hypothetical protein|nr:hypothetical protein [Rhizomicrobium sp.]